jgi:putative oxidoreductase
MDIAYALGRVFVPIVFIVEAIKKLMNVNGVAKMLADRNIPIPVEIEAYVGLPRFQAAGFLLAGIELLSALMIVVGFKARWAALMLVVFTAAATVLYHDFWSMNGAAAATHQITALRNLAIIGALLMIAAVGSGPYSLDGRSTPRMGMARA